MNFNQLSRLSPFIRVASRHIASTKTINKACVKLIPIRCLATDSKTGKSIPLNDFEAELEKKREHHGKEDWGNFISISWQIGLFMGLGCVFIVFLSFRKSNLILMEFDTSKIALEDTKDLNVDND